MYNDLNANKECSHDHSQHLQQYSFATRITPSPDSINPQVKLAKELMKYRQTLIKYWNFALTYRLANNNTNTIPGLPTLVQSLQCFNKPAM
jgi:hypothetical protein